MNNGIHDWTAGLSKSLLDAGDAKQSDLDDLSRAGKRLGLAAQFLAGMNVNGINKKAGATLLARACDSTKGTETDRTDLETALKASASSSDEHSTALATYLSKITGETVGGLVNPINNVLYYGNGNTAKTANANRVILGELGSAFGVTPPTMSKFDTNSASSDDEIKPVMDVFKPLEDLRKSLGGVKSKTAKSLTSYDIIKQNSQGRDVGFTLSYPSWNLNKKDDVSIEQIILYFEDVAKRIADLKNTSADAFKTVSGDWAKTLTSTYNIVDSFIQQESRGLIGTFVADDTKGIIAGMVRDTIDQAQIKIKAAYGAAIEALGTTPVAPAGAEATQEQIDAAKKAEAAKLAADKLAAVKTVEALEALEIFKKGGLKIGDLSQDIKDLIKGEKDQTKAQTLFTKILKGFADKNSASIALKALFNPEIKDNLKVEDETPDSAVEMIVSNQTGKKQNASTGKNSGEQGEQKGQIKPNTNPDDDPEVDDEKVTLKTFELSGLLNLDTGKLAEDSDEEVKSFNKLLADAMKSLKGKKKSVPPKTRKNKADSIIKELVARFKEDYSGDNPEDAEEEEEKKAANVAKNNAVTAATTLITEKVYKAFGIKKAPAGKGKKAPVKRGAVKGGRGNVVKRGPRNKSQKQGNKKK